MTGRIVIPTSQEGLILRQLQQRNTLRLFELFQQNRSHLEMWWDEDGPKYHTLEEMQAEIFNPMGTALRFGAWKDRTLIGYLSMTPSQYVGGVGGISYWVDESNCGKGYATAMVGAFTKYVFSELGYLMLFAHVVQDNTKSVGVLVRNGYALFRISNRELRFRRESER